MCVCVCVCVRSQLEEASDWSICDLAELSLHSQPGTVSASLCLCVYVCVCMFVFVFMWGVQMDMPEARNLAN